MQVAKEVAREVSLKTPPPSGRFSHIEADVEAQYASHGATSSTSRVASVASRGLNNKQGPSKAGLGGKGDQRETSGLSKIKKGTHIMFLDVSYTVRKRDGSEITILENIHGQCRPGRLLAIMGQSGSGKTSLVRYKLEQLVLCVCFVLNFCACAYTLIVATL